MVPSARCCLICSEDRRDGYVQAGGKGCTSEVSWLQTPYLRSRPEPSCFWPPVPGFLLTSWPEGASEGPCGENGRLLSADGNALQEPCHHGLGQEPMSPHMQRPGPIRQAA